MTREIVKVCTPLEREILEPHVRAYAESLARLRRVAGAFGATEGVTFDADTFSFYREKPEPSE